MKTVIFGMGKFYKNRKEQLMSYSGIEIVAYTDNNKSLWGKSVDGIQIVAPQNIKGIHYDTILIMSTYEGEIYAQLMELGIPKSKIKPWEIFHLEMVSGTREVFPGKNDNRHGRDDILIISTDLNYNGGSLAVTYAALALKNRGYNVSLAAPAGDDKFIEETTNSGITVNICPELPYVCDMEWIKRFDIVMVNVFQMMHSAIRTNSVRPTLWWIHEPVDIFNDMRLKYWNCVPGNDLDNIGIYAVSRIPRENFNQFYPNRVQKILHYGIPDRNMENRIKDIKEEKLIFAIIGYVCERKAQDIFCKAVNKLDNYANAEFWIIGAYGKDPFGEQIREMSTETEAIKMLGLLTREEIYNIFPQIDVVVCASREDPLPIVMTEGMMFGKVCITTDITGTADFIRDGENGFIIPADDDEALKERMEWIMNNKDRLADIGMNAGKTYEKYFAMDVFGENLENALMETKREWHLKRRT
ncbi:MAG: glycosyltransferase family 4 protein [Lachnospiraceae bacterium]|nr:glycosyltransferase family 4 protein [Lachnospiraceae bacterium]